MGFASWAGLGASALGLASNLTSSLGQTGRSAPSPPVTIDFGVPGRGGVESRFENDLNNLVLNGQFPTLSGISDELGQLATSLPFHIPRLDMRTTKDALLSGNFGFMDALPPNFSPVEVGANFGPALSFGRGAVDAATGAVPIESRQQAIDQGFASIEDLLGNQNAFVDARVTPLEQALQRSLEETEQDFARRGVGGSLGSREIARQETAGLQAIADQGALATQESLNAVNDVRNQIILAEAGIAADLTGQRRLEAETRIQQANLTAEAERIRIEASLRGEEITRQTALQQAEQELSAVNARLEGILGTSEMQLAKTELERRIREDTAGIFTAQLAAELEQIGIPIEVAELVIASISKDSVESESGSTTLGNLFELGESVAGLFKKK